MTDAPMAFKPSSRPLPAFVRRVTLCMALLFCLTWGLGLFAVSQLARFDDGARNAQVQGVGSATVLGQIAATLNALRAAEATQLLRTAAAEKTQREAERKLLLARLTGSIRKYESLDSSDEQKRLFMKFLSRWYSYADRSKLAFEALATGQTGRAEKLYSENLADFEDASDTIAELVRINTEHGRVVRDDLHGIFISSLWFILAAVGGVSILIVGMVLAIAWHEEHGSEGR